MKFCMSLERHLNLSTKKSENSLQEVSVSMSFAGEAVQSVEVRCKALDVKVSIET